MELKCVVEAAGWEYSPAPGLGPAKANSTSCPLPGCSKRQIQGLLGAGNSQPRALGCENVDFPPNLVFHVLRQLLLLQDSFLAVPVVEFGQCYFLKIFHLEIANPPSCNRTWGVSGFIPSPCGSAGALRAVLAVPCAAPRHAQHSLCSGKRLGGKTSKKA